uniref:Xylanase inhibitor C-terminal domain-containing protein n=1 Tax=Quercus lobata TaxID=97700 RepID=A0A7N2RBQ1_QUELO
MFSSDFSLLLVLILILIPQSADTKTTHLPPSQSHLSIPLYHRDMLAIKKNNLDYKTLVNSYEGSLFHTSVYNQLGGPIFDPAQSSSYEEIECNSIQCHHEVHIIEPCNGYDYEGISTNNSTTAEEQCRYHYSYADGETTDGRMIKEKLTFIMDQEAVENIVMGCSDSFGGNYSGKYAGILGLNHGISINNILLPIPSSYWHRSSSSGNGDDNGVLIDSGSSLTWFPKEVYTIFRDSFAKFTSKALYQLEHPAGIPVTFDICFRRHPFEGTTDIDFHSPIVKFHFISNSMFTASSITLTTSQLFLDMDNNTYCLAFASSSYNFTIIGSHQLQGTRLTFDLYHNNLILSPNDCS